MKINAVIATVVVLALLAPLAGAQEPFPSRLVTVDYLDGDALKAWYVAELARLANEVRAIGKIEG